MRRKLKGLTVYLIFVLSFMLTACVSDPASFYFDYDELKNTVASVELINYDSPDVKEVKKQEDILPFDFGKVEIIKTLDSKQREAFFEDLPKIHFHVCDDLTRYTNSANGLCIKIIYTSGNFVILCFNQEANFVGEFTSDGSVGKLSAYFVDNIYLDDFVNIYFKTRINS